MAPTEVARPPNKSKKKKRKAQVPDSENVEDPWPNEAEDDTTQPEKPSISVSKRAWDVALVASGLFQKKRKSPPKFDGKISSMQ